MPDVMCDPQSGIFHPQQEERRGEERTGQEESEGLIASTRLPTLYVISPYFESSYFSRSKA